MRILLVEDEKSLREAIDLNLQLEGYEVVNAQNGSEGFKRVNEQNFDLIILDVMLPEIDGFALCEKIRLSDSNTPIIFLTAKSGTLDRIKGLKLGGDDYITKPFHLEELLLRVKNIIRRRDPQVEKESHLFQFGKHWINFSNYTAKGVHGMFDLTKKEAQLLKLLIKHRNEAVSREQILGTVWDYQVYPTTRTIDNFIMSFRKYFETNPRKPEYFQSVRGVGYKFVDPDPSITS